MRYCARLNELLPILGPRKKKKIRNIFFPKIPVNMSEIHDFKFTHFNLFFHIVPVSIVRNIPSPSRTWALTGNFNLVYAVIRKRSIFHQLANLPTDTAAIQKALQRIRKSPPAVSRAGSTEREAMEGSRPAAPAEPGTLKASLEATPGPWFYPEN